MAVSARALVLKVEDARRTSKFWTAALGYEPEEDAPDFLVPPEGDGVRLHLDERDRTHLDLWLDRTTSDVETEVERLVALGAQRVEWTCPDDADLVVLADTEGNLFCVMPDRASADVTLIGCLFHECRHGRSCQLVVDLLAA